MVISGRRPDSERDGLRTQKPCTSARRARIGLHQGMVEADI